jgi:hypothetical protein
MRTFALLVGLWAAVGVAGARGLLARRPAARRDAQLRALLSGAVVSGGATGRVPAPRTAPDEAPAPARR